MTTVDMRVRTLVASAALAALTLAAVFAAPLALPGLLACAAAHDFLVSSDPADGARVDSPPAEAVLTFSDNIIEMAPLMRLTTIDGDLITEGAPRISGPDAHLDFPDNMADGEYRLAWSLVSADGHRVEDFITFTIGHGSAGSTEGTSGENTSSAEQKPAASESSSADGASLESAGEPSEKDVAGWRITGIVIMVAGIATIAYRIYNRRQQ